MGKEMAPKSPWARRKRNREIWQRFRPDFLVSSQILGDDYGDRPGDATPTKMSDVAAKIPR